MTDGVQLSSTDSVLVMRLGAIGEAVSLLPSIRELTDDVPEQNVTLIAEDVVQNIIRRDFSDIKTISANDLYSNRSIPGLMDPGLLQQFFRLQESLSKRNFDWFICFHTVFGITNAIKPRVVNSLVSADHTAGFSGMGLPRWDERVAPKSDHWEPMYWKNLRLTEEVTGGPVPDEPWIGIDQSRKEQLAERLRTDHNLSLDDEFLMVCAGAADPWRCWPTEKYQSVLNKFLDRYSVSVVFIGTREERKTASTIQSELPGGRAHNLAGETSLEELPELIDGANLFLANDTGPLHMAVARSVPTIGLFGPGVLNTWASYEVGWFEPIYKHEPEDPYLEKRLDDPGVLREISVDRVCETLFRKADELF